MALLFRSTFAMIKLFNTLKVPKRTSFHQGNMGFRPLYEADSSWFMSCLLVGEHNHSCKYVLLTANLYYTHLVKVLITSFLTCSLLERIVSHMITPCIFQSDLAYMTLSLFLSSNIYDLRNKWICYQVSCHFSSFSTSTSNNNRHTSIHS